jgi:hypothetical protein
VVRKAIEDQGMWSEKQTRERKRLRKLAHDVARATGRDYRDVLRILVAAQARHLMPDKPGAHPGYIQWAMEMHDAEAYREVAMTVSEILGPIQWSPELAASAREVLANWPDPLVSHGGSGQRLAESNPMLGDNAHRATCLAGLRED